MLQWGSGVPSWDPTRPDRGGVMATRPKKMTASEWARAAAAAREQVTGHCAVCGAEVTGTKKRAYCSQRCAMSVYRQRHRTELAAKRREYYARQKAAVAPAVGAA